HFFVSRYTNSNVKIFLCFLCVYIVGFLFSWKYVFISQALGIQGNFWFMQEAMIAYAFYQIGLLLKNSRLLEQRISIFFQAAILLFFLIILFLTYNLNLKGAVVRMASSSHGDPLWFLLTSLAGTVTVIFLSKLTPKLKAFLFLGENTLILMGLNGVFVHFINEYLALFIAPMIKGSYLLITLSCCAVTVLSMMICLPFVIFFERFMPSCVGKKRQ
ncbi:MAG: hypothetical protein NTZ51_07355, partial [Proteobacteria bacterium]|nr:hypothetical protein [Pseudomonadota bacterium]